MTKSQFSAIYMQYYVLFNTTVAVSFLLLNEIHNLSNNFMFSKLTLSNEKDLNILWQCVSSDYLAAFSVMDECLTLWSELWFSSQERLSSVSSGTTVSRLNGDGIAWKHA